MTVSVRLNEEDERLIKAYAEMNNMSLSELIRKAIKEYKRNPKTYTLDEVKKELGL